MEMEKRQFVENVETAVEEPVSRDISTKPLEYTNQDNERRAESANEGIEPKSFFSFANLLVGLPNILIPTLYGYYIGMVGVYTTLYNYATNCELYKAQTPCETLSGASCLWNVSDTSSAGSCIWKNTITCSKIYFDESSCSAEKACAWNYNSNECGNKIGYSSTYKGLFAGAMIIGAMIGSFCGGILTKKLNYKMSFLLIGIIAIIGAVLTHVSTAIYNYWLLFAARILIGFAMGWQAYTAPHYTDKFASKKYVKMLGTLFQVFTAFGSFVCAIIGICLGNTIKYETNVNANLKGRMQGVQALPTLLSVLVCFLPLLTKNANHSETHEDIDQKSSDNNAAAPKRLIRKYPVVKMIGPMLIGVIMAATLQFTGINANMNYAPIIMSNLGVNELVGNIIVMGWNALTAFAIIPLSKRFTMRQLFLTSAVVGSLACIFLCGIPVYPGVTKVDMARNVVAIIGVIIFLLAYESGIGPCFFVLAIDVFPSSFRPIGSAFTVFVMFIFNMIINIFYPIATEGMSGGPSGNQNKGQSIAFLFFGCIGIVTAIIEYFFLHPWKEQSDEDNNYQSMADVDNINNVSK